MDKRAAAHVLESIASLLELKGENPFKVRAFSTAAQVLESFTGDLPQALDSGALAEMKGIGPATLEVIRETALTGRSSLLESLQREIPAGLVEMRRVPGLGVTKIRTVHERLGISTLAELEAAARDGRLAALPRFGEKTAEKVLRGIAFVRRASGFLLSHDAARAADEARRALAALPGVARVEVAGSVRRRAEVVRDVDLVAVCDGSVPEVAGVDVRCTSADRFGHAWVRATGSVRHWEMLAARATQCGLRLDEAGLWRGGEAVPCPDEKALYAALGLAWIPPELREGGDEIDLRVLFREEFRNNMDMIRNIPILNPLNKTVYLSQVAAIEPGEGPIEISRENQTRIVTVTANISGRDLGSVVKDIKARLAPMEKELPAGYFYEFGGAYEQMNDAFLILAGVFALAVLLIYMVMASQFESFLHPFVIMFAIPMSLIGVVLFLIIMSQSVNLMVGVGFILLAGIAVANGIVMIDYMNQLKRRGVERREAIIQGAVTRLRPVLLTALATILGMIPMAVSRSMGSEMRSPMAITVIGGLAATTFMTLFVIPIMYSLFERVSFKDKPAEK